MVRAHKPKVRGLAFLQVFLQPPDLLAPECLAGGIALRHVVDIAVQYDEVATPPVERIVGGRREIEEFIEIAVVALVVAKRGEECGFAQQLALDVEENRPERSVRTVGYQIAGVEHKIRRGVLQNCADHLAVYVVPCARVAIDDKLKRRRSVWRRLEGALSFLRAGGIVVVSRTRLQACERDLFDAQHRRGLFQFTGFGSERRLARLYDPNYGRRFRTRVDDVRAAGKLLLRAGMRRDPQRGKKEKPCFLHDWSARNPAAWQTRRAAGFPCPPRLY